MASRETVREAIAALLTTALVGVGKPCKQVTAYKPSSIDVAPLVAVMSAGAKRQFNSVGGVETVFAFALAVFVPDEDTASGWTSADVEDRLDWIEREIASVVEANRTGANWTDLDFSGEPSSVEDVSISGAQYATEVFMLSVTIL